MITFWQLKTSHHGHSCYVLNKILETNFGTAKHVNATDFRFVFFARFYPDRENVRADQIIVMSPLFLVGVHVVDLLLHPQSTRSLSDRSDLRSERDVRGKPAKLRTSVGRFYRPRPCSGGVQTLRYDGYSGGC